MLPEDFFDGASLRGLLVRWGICIGLMLVITGLFSLGAIK